jgi:hypothetical protein
LAHHSIVDGFSLFSALDIKDIASIAANAFIVNHDQIIEFGFG